MTLRHSGITREYLPTFSLSAKLPSIEEVIKDTPNCLVFIEHVTRNHRGLNWKIYRHKLSPENVNCFIYAFAYTAKSLNPSNSSSWQFEANARRLQKEIVRKNIKLSDCEQQLLNLCKNFKECAPIKAIREKEITDTLESLEQLYLG